MVSYIGRRLLQMIVILLGVSLLTFMLSHLTGDPAALLLSPSATQADIESLRHALGLDKPIYMQYAKFLFNVMRGHFPLSLTYNENPLDLLLERIPATALLVLSAAGLSFLLSIPIGLFLALRRTKAYSSALMSLTIIGYSTPVYWQAIIMVLLFSITLRWFPPSGSGSLRHLILPVATLTTQISALLVRMTWGVAVEVLSTDYVQTARAKGLSEAAVVFRHVMRNSMIPVVTVFGLQIAGLMGNAIMTEVIFAWPGVARLTVEAIYHRDYPLVQACVMFMAVVFVFVNMVVDLLYCLLDPRIKYN